MRAERSSGTNRRTAVAVDDGDGDGANGRRQLILLARVK